MKITCQDSGISIVIRSRYAIKAVIQSASILANLQSFGRTTKGAISIYLAGSVLTNAISLLTWPVYSRFIKPVDYAPVAILTSIVGVYASLTNAGVQYPIILEATTGKLKQALQRGVIWSTFALVILLVASPIFVNFYSKGGSEAKVYSLPSLIIWFLVAGSGFAMLLPPAQGYLRATKRPYSYVAITLIPIFLGRAAGILIALVKGNGILALASATMVSGVLAALMSLGILKKTTFPTTADGTRTKDYTWGSFLSVSLPYIPHMAFSKLMWNTPRWWLGLLKLPAEVSFYSMAISVARPISLMFHSLNLAWAPEVVRVTDSKVAQRAGAYASLFCLFVGGISCFLAALPEGFYTLLLGNLWGGIRRFVPCVVINIICMGFYAFPAAVLLKVRKTNYAPRVSGVGLVSTVILCWILGRWFGSSGVAWGLTVGSILYLASGCFWALHEAKAQNQILTYLIPVRAMTMSIAGLVITAFLSAVFGESFSVVGWLPGLFLVIIFVLTGNRKVGRRCFAIIHNLVSRKNGG